METITEEEAVRNPTLEELVGVESELKNMIVEYVGEKLGSQKVTVQMIVEVLATDFPEFLLVIAEENWIRGYHQALEDVDAGRQAQLDETSTETVTDDEWVRGYRQHQDQLNGDIDDENVQS